MIQIKRFVFNMIEENTYIIWDDSLECVIIDCGAFYEEERQTIVDFIQDNHLKPVHLLATHAHPEGVRKRRSCIAFAQGTGAEYVRNAAKLRLPAC